MHLSIILDMAADALPDRRAFTDDSGTLTYSELRDGARSITTALGQRVGDRTVFLGLNSCSVPLALFSSALSGTAFTPLSYRLTDTELRRVAERAAPGVAIVDDDVVDRLTGIDGLRVITTSELRHIAAIGSWSSVDVDVDVDPDPDAVGVLLFTSGTTGEPKAALLRHTHLSSYVMSTLEFDSAGEDEAALVSVPPYHIAGISAMVSSLYTGRRVVYLANFSPEAWVEAIAANGVTHAMVVPTMLGRVLDVVESTGSSLRTLRHLAYGGGRMPVAVIARALRLLPETDFVNAYGLTETSSTISILGPEDHRFAFASVDPRIRRRLSSVGRPHDSIEISIRDELGQEVADGTIGEIWVRGDQVSGEYSGQELRLRDGWFPTNDGGSIDEFGYLYVDGRLDDVIVRGGENISPGEIEEVLRQHPDVDDVAVIGLPSEVWGEQVAAIIVPRAASKPDATHLRQWVRERLRSTRVPERIEIRQSLPYNETGKLLRRNLKAELTKGPDA